MGSEGAGVGVKVDAEIEHGANNPEPLETDEDLPTIRIDIPQEAYRELLQNGGILTDFNCRMRII